ncbi:hypothetical protein JTB14_005419 [Gonioctena quinquepunctata]|nr:hypothetical protein JTB14_005419 [Gonioctena quinquepunctata]
MFTCPYKCMEDLSREEVKPVPQVKARRRVRKRKKMRGPHEQKFGQISPPLRNLRILTVFSYLDTVGEALQKAAEKLGFELTSCTSDVTALEEFQAKSHDLVVIDTRTNKGLDYDTLCR